MPVGYSWTKCLYAMTFSSAMSRPPAAPQSKICRVIRGNDTAVRALRAHGLRVRAEEEAQLVEARVDVALADLDEAAEVVRLEHQERDEVGRLGLLRAEGARDHLDVARQVALVLGREAPEILRRAQYAEVDGLEAVALARLELGEHVVHPLHARHVFVDHVEKDGVDELSKDLRGGRVALHHRAGELVRRALVAGGHGQDAARAEVNGGGERRGETDAAVAVPAGAH